MLQFGSTAANQFTAASKSICSIAAAGITLVTRRIQHSKLNRCFTCSWERSDRAFFQRATPLQSERAAGSASIQRIYRKVF